MEELAEGILLRPRRAPGPRLSWEETARAMAETLEDWSAWDETLSDGLEQIPWHTVPAKRVAETSRGSSTASHKLKRTKK